MANWDIFHSDSLEVERNLSAGDVHSRMAKGEIRKDDLARPAGSREQWVRLTELPELTSAAESLEIRPVGRDLRSDLEDLSGSEDENASDEFEEDPRQKRSGPGSPSAKPPAPRRSTSGKIEPTPVPDDFDRDLDLDLRSPAAKIDLPIDDDLDYDPQAQDEEAAGFTLARGSAGTVEELDLAAMVDVAFQLVLFFLVTASTIVFKTLEVPKPNPEQKKGPSVAASVSKTLDELAKDNILVDIDAAGNFKIDREPAPGDFEGLAFRLRKLRQESGRTGMLLTAESTTKHKYAVLAYDVANDIGLRIGIAVPKPGTEKPPGAAAQPKAK